MKRFQSVDDMLDFAIGEEEAAVEFYTELAGRMDNPAMSQVFREFAEEERGHKKKLLHIKAGKLLLHVEEKMTDLKISEYLVDAEVSSDMDYQQALILAMKKEKAAFRLYTDLAATTEDAALRKTLLGLAQEEAKHKLRFEIEYDDYVYQGN